MVKEPKEKLSVRVPCADVLAIRAIAKRQGLDLSKVINAAIKEYLAKEVKE